jgi:putative heme-binding domain-containing protein
MRLFSALLALASLACAAEPFEIREGDRVLLLGDALLERENTYGTLETRLHEQFPDRTFTVRNLSWAGDTPAGWSRASFDPAETGLARLKEHLDLVKPTVVFLGYGMAASLQELTENARDWTLNPDPRYQAEKMNVARFKRELGALVDLISGRVGVPPAGSRVSPEATSTAPGGTPGAAGGTPTLPGNVRFVLLSPIRHEDLRATRPGLPDPAEHNKLIEQYSKAVEEVAKEKGALFVSLWKLPYFSIPADREDGGLGVTDNGVTPNEFGMQFIAGAVSKALGHKRWFMHSAPPEGPEWFEWIEKMSAAILRKNDLFFHRFRPANSTYLFGFRKHEQGQNAKEMAEFDPIIAAADAEIDRIKRGGKSAATPAGTAQSAVATAATVRAKQQAAPLQSLPVPTFDLDPSLEISLWAESPLLGKPTQMAWDAAGRLWVACTPIYPQIEPGAHPDDKVVVLEDTDRDGKADKSVTFADDLLIPSGVATDIFDSRLRDSRLAEEARPTSIENLAIENRKSSAAYVAASTELLHLTDTDGDGRADQRRVVLSGFGTEDTHHNLHTLRWGPDGRLYMNQSVYTHSHLETPWGLVRLNAGGCLAYDPRTERVEVFMQGLWNPWGHAWDRWGQSFFTDGAGFAGLAWAFPGAVFNPSEGARKTMPTISPGTYPKFAGLEIIHSPLFPADWQGTAVTCDFRAHRLVRFQINDLAPAKSGYVTQELPDLLRTADLAFRPIDVRLGPDGALYVADWTNPVINHGEVDFRDPRRDHVHGRIWRLAPKGRPPVAWSPPALPVPDAGDPASPQPRARLAALRTHARQPSLAAVTTVLAAAQNAPADDPHYEFAAWRSINDLAEVWTEALAKGEWVADSPEKEKQLAWGLGAIRPELARGALAHLLAAGKVPLDGSGPWIELLGQAGDGPALQQLWEPIVVGYAGDCCENDATRALTEKVRGFPNEAVAKRALAALLEAARTRGARPAAGLEFAPVLFHASEPWRTGAVELAGLWKAPGTLEKIPELLGEPDLAPATRRAVFKTLRALDARALLEAQCAPGPNQRDAVLALAALDFQKAAAYFPAVLAQADDATWRELLAIKGAPDALAAAFPQGVPADRALKIARELGRPGAKLVAALFHSTDVPKAPYTGPAPDIVRRDGDPARGEEIYHRPALACVTCHAIGGAGGRVGPELGALGASAPLDYIIESLYAPNAKVKEGYHAVSLTLQDGTVAAGVLARETEQDFILRTAAGTEQTVPKARVTTRENLGSLMPAGLLTGLQPREHIDLAAFLAQLGKPGVYDASRATVARTWWVFTAGDVVGSVSSLRPGDATPKVFTNVDGRLPRERLAASGAAFLAAKLHLATAGPTRFTLAGIREAWLDGQPLPVASEPNPRVELGPGDHLLVVKVDAAAPPDALRAEVDAGRFLAE